MSQSASELSQGDYLDVPTRRDRVEAGTTNLFNDRSDYKEVVSLAVSVGTRCRNVIVFPPPQFVSFIDSRLTYHPN
jgi:hypothetical protein